MKKITYEILVKLLKKFSEKIALLFVKKEVGKGLSANDYTTEEKTKLSELRNYTHPASGTTAGTYRSVTVNAQGHVTGGTNPTTLAGYGIKDAAVKEHRHDDSEIIAMDAAKLTGIIEIERLPAGALERCVVVESDAARFALTKASVQVGDTVKVIATGLMYFVKDDSKLSSEGGYEVYTAGSASSVSWAGVTGKPTTFTPSTHKHKCTDIEDLEEITDAEIDAIIAGTFTE